MIIKKKYLVIYETCIFSCTWCRIRFYSHCLKHNILKREREGGVCVFEKDIVFQCVKYSNFELISHCEV